MNYQVKNIYKKTNADKIEVQVPGSKSVTARAMLTAALADGESTLYGAQFSDDCETFLNCLTSLGIRSRREEGILIIQGCGGKIEKKSADIYVGSAGTAGRFMPAFLAFCDGEYSFGCSAQFSSRPISSLINSLEAVGARFTFKGKDKSYPFTLRGARSVSDGTKVDIGESSQFLSALLISSVLAGKPFDIEVEGSHNLSYVEMTLSVMRSFGVQAEKTLKGYRVCGKYRPAVYYIEPDVSAACYFYAINRILGTSVTVSGITDGSLQGDIAFIKLIKDFDGGRVDMGAFSDQTLTLAAIAPYFSKPTEIVGVAHIRKQECDRIRAICENLRRMGVGCEEREDGVKIYPSEPRPAHIDTFGDHRVAMSFAVTGLRADGIVIENAEVCSKTFKNYFETLDAVTQKLSAK